ncbi:hypothetical protein Avbf_14751 [Armadillidium vulgare]|nr:hypothetical protein Avbf_14751 [Armadillidium vulgare]
MYRQDYIARAMIDVQDVDPCRSKVEIKDEFIESNEDFINDVQRFEQVSVLEEIQQENVFYPSVDVKEEIEMKFDPLYIKEEYIESGYHVDQISGLDDSQIVPCHMLLLHIHQYSRQSWCLQDISPQY